MIVLHINEDLSARLEQRAALAGMNIDAYTQELLRQAVEEEEDLDLAVEEHRQNGATVPLEEAIHKLGLGS